MIAGFYLALLPRSLPLQLRPFMIANLTLL